MEPPGTAVRTTIPAGNARPSGSKLSVLLRPSYVLCRDGRQAQLLADPKTDDDAYTGRPSSGRDLFPRDRAGLVAAAETWRQRCSSSTSWPGCVASPPHRPTRPAAAPRLHLRPIPAGPALAQMPPEPPPRRQPGPRAPPHRPAEEPSTGSFAVSGQQARLPPTISSSVEPAESGSPPRRWRMTALSWALAGSLLGHAAPLAEHYSIVSFLLGADPAT